MWIRITKWPEEWEKLNVQVDWWWVIRMTLDSSYWLFLPDFPSNIPERIIDIIKEKSGEQLVVKNQDTEQDDKMFIVEEPVVSSIEPVIPVAEKASIIKKPRKTRASKLKSIVWMEFSQLEIELTKKRKRLQEAILRKAPVEFISWLTDYIKELAQTILTLNPSRHSTTWIDVDYLNNLELEYLIKWYMSDYKIAQNIVITPEYINISWLELRRYNEQAPYVKDSWIIKTKDGIHTLFKIGAASKQASSIWCNILNLAQLRLIMRAIPWSTTKEKEFNFIRILNISLAGYFHKYNESLHSLGDCWVYWLLSPNRAHKLIFNVDKYNKVSTSTRAHRFNAYILRCIKK